MVWCALSNRITVALIFFFFFFFYLRRRRRNKEFSENVGGDGVVKLTVSLRNQQQFFSNKPDYTITACLISDQWSTCRNIIFFFIYIVYIYTRVVVVCDVVDTLRFDYTITISMSCFILFCVFYSRNGRRN